jgi:hypothetical protein
MIRICPIFLTSTYKLLIAAVFYNLRRVNLIIGKLRTFILFLSWILKIGVKDQRILFRG